MRRKRRSWFRIFVGADGKLAVVSLGFLLWMIAVTSCWMEITLENNKLAELPHTVVYITLALGTTKVTHRIAEGNWEKIVSEVIGLLRKRKDSKKKRKRRFDISDSTLDEIYQRKFATPQKMTGRMR